MWDHLQHSQNPYLPKRNLFQRIDPANFSKVPNNNNNKKLGGGLLRKNSDHRLSMDEVITAADASANLRSYPSEPAVLPPNLPLLAAFLSFVLAQFLKLFTTWYKEKRWDSKRMLSSGGMPSSHSATVTALAAAIGLQKGTGGSDFAIAVVLACVVMYDASGVRLHAGRQAELLNQIVCELPPEHPVSTVRPLRDSLGHTPLQVVAGAVLGFLVAYLMKNSG